MIAALFVQTNGAYYGLPGVDPWDEQRDARLYPGPHPVVAHPPCARWCCAMAPQAQTMYGLRVGDDGGCFESALASVRAFGGVLEHPAHSLAWGRYALPRPLRGGGWQRGICGGWSCYVEQGRLGHVVRKATWLYACGTDLPRLPWGPMRTGAGGTWSNLSRRQRAASPPAFRDVLIAMARSVRDTPSHRANPSQ